jgi:hypothetical protein
MEEVAIVTVIIQLLKYLLYGKASCPSKIQVYYRRLFTKIQNLRYNYLQVIQTQNHLQKLMKISSYEGLD